MIMSWLGFWARSLFLCATSKCGQFFLFPLLVFSLSGFFFFLGQGNAETESFFRARVFDMDEELKTMDRGGLFCENQKLKYC